MRRRTEPARSIYTRSWHQVMILAAAACQCFVIYKHKRPWKGRRAKRAPSTLVLQNTLSLKNQPRATQQRGHQPNPPCSLMAANLTRQHKLLPHQEEQHKMPGQQHLKGS